MVYIDLETRLIDSILLIFSKFGMDQAWMHSCLLTSELKKKMALWLSKEEIAQLLTKTE